MPKNNRICGFHLSDNNWAKLLLNISHPYRTLTAKYIHDFATFIKERTQTFDFNYIEGMSEVTHE